MTADELRTVIRVVLREVVIIDPAPIVAPAEPWDPGDGIIVDADAMADEIIAAVDAYDRHLVAIRRAHALEGLPVTPFVPWLQRSPRRRLESVGGAGCEV